MKKLLTKVGQLGIRALPFILVPLSLTLVGNPIGAQEKPPQKAKAAKPAPKKPGRFTLVNRVMAVVNDKIITIHDIRKEIGLRLFTDPSLRNNPEKLKAEEKRVLQSLAQNALLEQAIYSLELEPAQIDMVVENYARDSIRQLEKKAGSTGAFLEQLKAEGKTIREKREEIKKKIRISIFLEEKVTKLFAGAKGQLKVSPKEMFTLYKAKESKGLRSRPAFATLTTFEIPFGQDKEKARKIALKLQGEGGSNNPPEAPQGVIKAEFIIVDCQEKVLEATLPSLGFKPGPNSPIFTSRESVNRIMADFSFTGDPAPRITAPQESSRSFKLIRLNAFSPKQTIPFTNPVLQDVLRFRLLEFKRLRAERTIIKKLWDQSRIWPPDLKKDGPPNF